RPTYGFVLSGGGAYAAYEVGVLRALCTGASPATAFTPIDAAVVSGTSAGSINAALIAQAADGPAAVDFAERIWARRIADPPGGCGSHVLRIRANPLAVLNPACLASGPTFYSDFIADGAFLAAETAARAA